MSEEMNEALGTAELEVGSVVSGKVTSLDDKKVTVDIGYKFEGVIPIRELSVLRIDHPNQVIQVGDEVHASVLKVDDEAGAVILSKRNVAADEAWNDLQSKADAGASFDVVVHDVVKGGLVTDVGVRGFIPASLVDTKFVEDLEQLKGQTLRVKVAEIDRENNKLILSRKAVLEQEQGQELANRLTSIHVGDVLNGTVKRLADFGAFVDIGGADGLVHISELAFEHVKHPSEVVQPGQEVKVRVLRVEPSTGRLSLSIKAAQPDPWERVASELREGDVLTGTVKRVVDFGAFVEVKPGIEGLVHVSQISHQHVARATDALHVGDEVQVKVLGVSPADKRVSLSIKEVASEVAPRKEAEKFFENQRQEPSGTGATLGDLFGDLFKRQD